MTHFSLASYQLCGCTEEREVAEKLFCCDSFAQSSAHTLVNPLSTIGGGDEIVNQRKKFPITSSSLLMLVVRLVADCTLQYFGYFSFPHSIITVTQVTNHHHKYLLTICCQLIVDR